MGIGEIALLALGVFLLYQVGKLLLTLLLKPLAWLLKLGLVAFAALLAARLIFGWLAL